MGEMIVVGGGVVGSAAAYHLARQGRAVTLIDRADAGQATAAGAGIISPGTGFPAGPLLALALAATEFYQTLLAQLAEDGAGDTGYATCGGSTNWPPGHRCWSRVSGFQCGRAVE